MPPGSEKTREAFRELLELLRGLDDRFFEGPNALRDAASELEGYRWIFSVLQVAFDCYVWADPRRPRFVEIVGPYKKWGGDNADAFYHYAPLDPERSYRVCGRKGDAVYLSLTVYGGPRDGRYSERIVGSLNDRQMQVAPDGSFELTLSATEQPGHWIRLEPDAVCAITRDYVVDPSSARRASWEIEALDPPGVWREDDAELARRFRAAATWVAEQAKIAPLPPGEANTVLEPFPVPKLTYGWAAGDAAYAMGSFELDPGHALLIQGRSPACAFWNMCLWNPFLHTYNYDYERVTINGGQVRYAADGSFTLVVAERDPGHPNWVSTQGHPRGRIWFRWFHPSETPQRPSARVVALADVPRA
jgi:hypothetical protein